MHSALPCPRNRRLSRPQAVAADKRAAGVHCRRLGAAGGGGRRARRQPGGPPRLCRFPLLRHPPAHGALQASPWALRLQPIWCACPSCPAPSHACCYSGARVAAGVSAQPFVASHPPAKSRIAGPVLRLARAHCCMSCGLLLRAPLPPCRDSLWRLLFWQPLLPGAPAGHAGRAGRRAVGQPAGGVSLGAAQVGAAHAAAASLVRVVLNGGSAWVGGRQCRSANPSLCMPKLYKA